MVEISKLNRVRLCNKLVHKVIIQSKSTRGQDNLISNNLGNKEIKMVITKKKSGGLLEFYYAVQTAGGMNGWIMDG